MAYGKQLLGRLKTAVLNRVWYVHPAVVLLVQLPPAACLPVLTTAAKPSTQRLHLRNLFISGRRYYFQATKAGFQMNSNSKIPWLQRRRTRLAAVLFANISETEGGLTRLRLTARMTPWHFINVWLLPIWMSLLVIFGPFEVVAKISAVLLLFVFSWIGHRYGAMLQALDMVYFVQVALEEFIVTDVAALPAEAANVIDAQDFQQAWDKFYAEHKGEREP